jgi:hypothetical protein
VTDDIGGLLERRDDGNKAWPQRKIPRTASRITGCIYRQFQHRKLQCSEQTGGHYRTLMRPPITKNFFLVIEISRYILPRIPRR